MNAITKHEQRGRVIPSPTLINKYMEKIIKFAEDNHIKYNIVGEFLNLGCESFGFQVSKQKGKIIVGVIWFDNYSEEEFETTEKAIEFITENKSIVQ